jgi:hypothetical protein
MARTPADYPGRPGSKIVPNETDFMDLDEKVARRKALDEARGRDRKEPWYRRLFHRRPPAAR